MQCNIDLLAFTPPGASCTTRAHSHYNNVIMGTMASQITSPTTQTFIRAHIKENIKAPRHWPLCGEITVDSWIPRTNGQQRGICFQLMTSSWISTECRAWIFHCICIKVWNTINDIYLVTNALLAILLLNLGCGRVFTSHRKQSMSLSCASVRGSRVCAADSIRGSCNAC